MQVYPSSTPYKIGDNINLLELAAAEGVKFAQQKPQR